MVSLFIGLAFFAILVWTAGQTIVNVVQRIIGGATGNGAVSIAMLVVSLISFALAIYGHATLVASFRVVGIASAGISLLALIVLAGSYVPSQARASTCALAAGLGIFAGCWLAELQNTHYVGIVLIAFYAILAALEFPITKLAKS